MGDLVTSSGFLACTRKAKDKSESQRESELKTYTFKPLLLEFSFEDAKLMTPSALFSLHS